MAQVTNQALAFEENGRVSLGSLPDGTATGVTLQFWMNPQEWIPGANVLAWGESLGV